MMKAPRYPDIIDPQSSSMLQAASRFTGVLNIAYHSPSSYAQKHLRKHIAPSKAESNHDALLAAKDGNMTLRKLHKETVRRQKFLRERKQQAEMEETRRRERLLEERHLRRLEQAKLIRYRIHSSSPNHAFASANTQRAYSERAFPFTQARPSNGERPLNPEKDILARITKTPGRQMLTTTTGYQQQQNTQQPHEGMSYEKRARSPLRRCGNDSPQIDVEGDAYTGPPLQEARTFFNAPPDAALGVANSIADTLQNDLKYHDQDITESFSGKRSKINDPENSAVPTCFDASKQYAQLQPLDVKQRSSKDYDLKSTQSEPPLRPRILRIFQDHQEDELMKNLASLNEKLAALRLKKSFNFNAQETTAEPRWMPIEGASRQIPFPENKPKKQWRLPKLVRTPTSHSRRSRAR